MRRQPFGMSGADASVTRRTTGTYRVLLFLLAILLTLSSCLPRRIHLDRDIPVHLQPGMPQGFEEAVRDCLSIWNREFGTGLRVAGYHEGGVGRDGRNTVSLGSPPRPFRAAGGERDGWTRTASDSP